MSRSGEGCGGGGILMTRIEKVVSFVRERERERGGGEGEERGERREERDGVFI